MSQVQIKIHNVMHNQEDFSASEIENEMLRMCMDDRVEDVRVAKGNQNSPVFIIIDESVRSLSVKDAKSIARQMLREFDRKVSGIDIDRSVSDSNIKIQHPTDN